MSGGPVLSEDEGSVIGVIYARDNDKHISYLIPMEAIKKWLEENGIEVQSSSLKATIPYSGFEPGEMFQEGYYVPRESLENDIANEIIINRALNLWGPEKFGKTWLINAIKKKLIKEHPDIKTVYLSFDEISTRDGQSRDDFITWFIFKIYTHFRHHLSFLIREWQNSPSKSVSFEIALEKVLSESRILIIFDQLNRLIKLDAADEILSFLRAMVSNQELHQPQYANLFFLGATSVPPGQWVKISKFSPFNATNKKELPPFSDQELKYCAAIHGLSISNTELRLMKDILGGHPFLCSKAIIQASRTNDPLSDIIEDTENPLFGSYLDGMRNELEEGGLLQDFFIVCDGGNTAKPHLLFNAGVIDIQHKKISVRFPILRRLKNY